MKIALAIVAYNEEKYLPRLFEDVRAQDYPHDRIEVLLIDSGSTDGTKALMEEFKESDEYARVFVGDNPKKRQSAGWNIAINEVLSETDDPAQALIRVDAHARIPKDFVASCAAAMEDEYVAGGARPTICDSDGGWSLTLWMAEESMFGSSVSSARRTGDEKTEAGASGKERTPESPSDRTYVKSLFHACYRREVLEKAGGFREDLGRTEDNEYHYRIRKLGYKIYKSPDIYSEQYVRPSFGKMIKQKTGNGFWVGRTLGIVPGCISIYHLVPLAFLLAIIATTVLAILGLPWSLQLLAALYISVAVLMAVFSAFKMQYAGERVPIGAVLLPILFFCLHVCYGAGTFLGILSIPFGRKR